MERQERYYENRPSGPRQAPVPRPGDVEPVTNRQKGGSPPPRGPRTGGNQGHFASALIRVLMTLGLCIFLAFFILGSASDLFGLNQKDQMYEVTIPESKNIKQVSEQLKNLGIIDQKLTFRLYAGLNKNYQQPQGGDYIFNSNMSYDQILSMLSVGNVVIEEISLTFIEGESLDEIAKKLEKAGVCEAEEFLNYMQTNDFSRYRFANLIPNDDLLYMRMEGYVFPDTYNFYTPELVDSVADKFLKNFDQHLTPELASRMDDIGMSIHEAITLASIIQKEAGGSREMPRVSSVFHNRLDNKANFPQLQSDVTIFYVEDHIKGLNRPYTVSEEQSVFDAYNTYVKEGLPIGPICNPGIGAIKAALYPAESNDYYFVTDIIGDYYYAASLAEHNQNIVLAEQQDESGEGKIGGGIMTHDGADAQK